MPVSVFLSHNFADKSFVRRIAKDLDNQGVRCWLDEAEIKVGDSLIEKIRQGIDQVDYVAVILSPNSVDSVWVQREVDVAMNQEIFAKKVKVLPVMLHHCELPGFLLGKFYADFTDDMKYDDAFEKFITSLGYVFNKNAHNSSRSGTNLGHAINQAVHRGLPLLSKPFHRPFQYIGMVVSDAANAVDHTSNKGGNIIIETDDCHMLLEAEGNFISYVDVQFKKTAPHFQNQEFDSEAILGALSINPTELELIKRTTHCHVYYDHRKRLKVSIMCLYDEAPISVGFSAKYYGM